MAVQIDLVWRPKYRFRILKGDVANSVDEIARQLCGWNKLEILELNVQIEHVYTALTISPKY